MMVMSETFFFFFLGGLYTMLFDVYEPRFRLCYFIHQRKFWRFSCLIVTIFLNDFVL
jgi:hypothetical protein